MVPKASGARETDARLQMPRRGLSWEPCLFQAFAQSVPHTQVAVPFFVNEASDGEARIAGDSFRTELTRLLGTFERDQRRSPVLPGSLSHFQVLPGKFVTENAAGLRGTREPDSRFAPT